MNAWIRRSIELANAPGYLDRLSEVYRVGPTAPRRLAPDVQVKLRMAFKGQDRVRLIRALLDLGRFPVKDPYGAFLKRDPEFVKSNPRTVRRLANRVLALGLGKAIENLEEPIEFNQQIGPLFRRWLHRHFRFVAPLRFGKSKGLAFLEGTNGIIMSYANITLGCGLDRGIDFVAKCGNRFFIGEAKFITDMGGQQAERLGGIIQRFLRDRRGNATRVLVVDGVPWIRGDNKLHRMLRRQQQPIMSALLLREYLATACH